MKQHEKGFSFVELMTVCAIIGVLALIATPSLMSMLPTRNLGRAARDMVSNFRRARTLAIKLNRSVVIKFDAAHGSYTVDGEPFIKILNSSGNYENLRDYYGGGVTIGYPGRSDPVMFTADQVTFSSLGMADAAGYVYLKNRKSDEQTASPEGYRIGIRGMSNIVMERCGAGCVNSSTGAAGKIDCTKDAECSP